jgi:hypothetical protein
MATATVTPISASGCFYANECISITIESPANTGTTQYTTVYKLTFLRGDLSTFESAEQIITNGQTIKINLNDWAKDHLFHQVPTGNATSNTTAYGWVGVSTKVNEYDTEDCTETAGTYADNIDPDNQEFTVLSAYLQPDRAGSLVSNCQADFDTFSDVYVCKSGYTYLNVFGAGRAINGTATLENGTTTAANIGTPAIWDIIKIQRGVNGVPATATSVTYQLLGSKTLTVHFCSCKCKDTDTRVLFLEPMGAWTVMDFDEVASINASQQNTVINIDNDCRNLQYGGFTNAFATGGVTKLYRSKIGVRKSNVRGFTMIANARKVMQLENGNWIKLQFNSQDINIITVDNITTFEFSASYTVEGQRVEK